MTETLTIRRPDDWHVHLRDGPMLHAVAGHTARQFARAIVMPNLTPPVTTAASAAASASQSSSRAPWLPGQTMKSNSILPCAVSSAA